MIYSSPEKRGKGKASAVKASARACYENTSVDGLRSRNIVYLKDQRFKKIYDPPTRHIVFTYLVSTQQTSLDQSGAG